MNVQYLSNEQGMRTGVLLQLSDYEKLMEDIKDMVLVLERREEETIPHEEFIAELRKDGIL